MHAPISVILPTLNAGATLGPTLVALGEALTEGLITEVLFADGGSSDDTILIADEVGADVIACKRGRGTQLATAANQARGTWLLFLHADSVLQTGWITGVRAHLHHPEQAGYFHLAFDDNSIAARIVASWANIRARMFGLPYGDQGVLISRSLYDKIGGYDAIPLMEDVALAGKLRGKWRALPATLTTSAEKYRRDGWLRRSFKNAGLVWRYRLGVDPAKLVKEYR